MVIGLELQKIEKLNSLVDENQVYCEELKY